MNDRPKLLNMPMNDWLRPAIEHIDAANHIESILDVPGLDAVLIGPFDLSASMGFPGQINHPDVQRPSGNQGGLLGKGDAYWRLRH